MKTIFKIFGNFCLPKKEEQGGCNSFGDKEFTVEKTKGCHWDHEETDDRGHQKISNQSVFDGSSSHWPFFHFQKSFLLASEAPNRITKCAFKKKRWALFQSPGPGIGRFRDPPSHAVHEEPPWTHEPKEHFSIQAAPRAFPLLSLSQLR